MTDREHVAQNDRPQGSTVAAGSTMAAHNGSREKYLLHNAGGWCIL